MAENSLDTILPDVEMHPESSSPNLTNQLKGASKTSLNTIATTATTQLRRSSRQAAKKSGLNATPPDAGNYVMERTQLKQAERSKQDRRPQDGESEPPHSLIQINDTAQLPHAQNMPSSFYLSEEQKDNYMEICVPLHSAALRGDWHAAEKILEKYPEVINMSITHTDDTILHIVSSTKHIHFAKKLVKRMNVEDLKLQNQTGATALWLAVASTDKMVDLLLESNKGLLKIRKEGKLPLLCAVWSGHKDVVECIYSKTNIADEKWEESDKKSILNSCIAEGLYDIALKIINHCKTEGTLMVIGTEVLRYLAYKPAAFDGKVRYFFRSLASTISLGSGLGSFENSTGVEIVRCIWGETVKQKHEDILKTIAGDSKNKEGEGLLFTAARLGNYKFIVELLKLYPEIAWDRNENKYTIFHVAVKNRHENVYNLLYELGSKKLGTLDNDGNSILHLAAMKPAQSRLNIVSGAALQMQRELLWFEEVKARVNSTEKRKWNKKKKSPQALFTQQHADLMAKGESWMKDTAGQCMVVAALIATIMFAAAFTLPGGNNGDTGHPLFSKKSAFTVFVVADAVSLCTSSASILLFLAIITSRYAEKDFLVSLPWKLLAGISTLFISIAAMMVAFSASFFLLYARSMNWIPILVATFAAAPVILFFLLQYRLFIDVIKLTFMSRHMFRPKERMI